MSQSVNPPPVEFVMARDVPFHVLHDTEFLPRGDFASFFVRPRAFADDSPKRWPDECNLGGRGGCLPDGMIKEISEVAIHVVGAGENDENDLFLVQILFSGVVGFEARMRSGLAFVRQVSVKSVLGAVEVPRLMPQEWFEVRVAGPDRLHGAYARISLLGVASFVST